VFWSDGVAFTADDVVFTFNDLIYNEKIPTSARDLFTIDGRTIKVEKINAFTVKFTLPFRFAPFLRSMGQSILPKHRLKKAVDEEQFAFTWGIDSEPVDIVGTGPYALSKYIPGQRVALNRNSLYWKRSSKGNPLPFIEKIVFVIVQNQDTLLLKFLEGELDYCSVRGTDYALLKPMEKKRNFTIYNTGPAFGSNFIAFNQNNSINPQTGESFVDKRKLSWFTNIDFRRAVAHAIDRERIIDILMNGLGYPQHAATSPSTGFFHNPNVKMYDYDLIKARRILLNAGFSDRNSDGLIEDESGVDVEFNLYTNSGSNERIQIAAIIRHDLQKLGMKVNFLSLEFNNLVSKLVANYQWDAIIIGLTGGIEPHFGKNVWASNGQLHMWHPRQEIPATTWEKRIDEIFNTAVQELDENKRKALYDEWQMVASEQLPVIYTVLNASIFAVRDKFENLNPSSYGGAFHNLEEIYIKRDYR